MFHAKITSHKEYKLHSGNEVTQAILRASKRRAQTMQAGLPASQKKPGGK